jgi:hypothetical protein
MHEPPSAFLWVFGLGLRCPHVTVLRVPRGELTFSLCNDVLIVKSYQAIEPAPPVVCLKCYALWKEARGERAALATTITFRPYLEEL